MKICFVAPNIYPFLSGNYDAQVLGGAEVQQVQIAQLLRSEGHDVSIVTLDHKQPDGQVIDGIRVYKAYRPSAGLIGLRYFYPRLITLWRAITKADADIYYTRAAGMLTALLAIFVRRYGKKYIYAGAHDQDFIPSQLLIRYKRDRQLYEYGLRRADAIIVQSEKQRSLLKRNYGLDGIVIPNFLRQAPVALNESAQRHVLWVGTLRDIKRPALFLELAQALPDVSFEMIGGPDTSNPMLYEQTREKAQQLPNVKFLGFQPFDETERHFDTCKVFVNTSSAEGFPNTFLQAMRRGIPIISFVDPDNMIAKNSLGVSVTTNQELMDAVSSFSRGNTWPPDGIRSFYLRQFSGEGVVKKYRELLSGLGA
jgi:glycosyltransferase involved in cell wall biosynthesis